MNNSFICINSSLVSSTFNINVIDQNNRLGFCIVDNIKLISLSESYFDVEVKREILYGDDGDAIVSVLYTSRIKTPRKMTEDDVMTELQNNAAIVLAKAFSSVSMMIAQITNESKMGTIVTPPMPLSKTVTIEKDI